jgi:hypothetical protein
MATKTEIRVVKLAAVAQGVALVTFPAASTIFTSSSDYDLSRSAYGAMFVPQAMTAVVHRSSVPPSRAGSAPAGSI